VKSIIIVTLAAPLLVGCSAFLQSRAPEQVVEPAPPAIAAAPVEEASPELPPASDTLQLRTARAHDAPPQLPRDYVKPENRLGDAEFKRTQAKALDGDRNAAMRLARMYSEGSNGVPRDERRMVTWLKHASTLDHAAASYQLYLYYLARGLDRDAVRYEQRALRQGYVLPVRLGSKRG
jgi:TPR repeat protein